MGQREPGMSQKSQWVAAKKVVKMSKCQREAGTFKKSPGMSGEQVSLDGDPGGEELAGH